MILPRAHGIRG
uniref:Uncharacterized protein n=1 Tax=Arundo donax TaxID=35708 RepID=A0A0A9A696_ARUDO